MMLVDDDRIEAEPVGQHELGQILLVERMRFFGVVVLVLGKLTQSDLYSL